MMVIVSTLFLLAISVSAVAILGTISNNMPRIIEVIESRGKPAMRSRTIHIGAMRSTGNVRNTGELEAGVYAAPRLVVSNTLHASVTLDGTVVTLPLAA
jgi:hypothetical protein